MAPVSRLAWSLILVIGPIAALARAQEPRAIVEKALNAIGGEEKIRPIKAIQSGIKGTLIDQDNASFHGTLVTQLPSRFKFELSMDVNGNPVHMIVALDGDRAWERINEEMQDVSPVELEDMRQSSYVDYLASLVPLLHDPELHLSLTDPENVDGSPAVGIKITAKGHPDVRLYFDRSTGVLVKTQQRRVDPATKKEVLREEVLGDYRVVDPTAADERVLRAAKVSTDDAALLDYLRKRTLDPARRDRILALVQKLGDNDFDTRERAKKDLAAEGEVALPILGQAVTNPDPEVAARAKECLDQIGKAPDPTVPGAVVRILGRRRPAGAAEALLAYLPGAPDQAVAQEVRRALRVLAYHDGQADPALVRAKESKDARLREAAADALGSDASSAGQRPGLPVYPEGVRRAMRGEVYREHKKVMEWQITDVQFFNGLEPHAFAKP